MHARIRVRRDDDRLSLEILDDGPGLPTAQALREGVGITNTRGRLRKLYGDRHRLILESRAPAGTRALVELPYDLAPEAVEPENEPVERLRHAASTYRR